DLINSDEINKIKENMRFLYKEKEVNYAIDQLKQMVKTGEKLLKALEFNDISVDFSTSSRFENCKERTQYFELKAKRLMYDRSDIDSILDGCTRLQRKCLDVMKALQDRLKEGTREYEEALAKEAENEDTID
ncbi:hypothetical protein, partial [Priestia megaterium]|uniref:hypothetical protein n=1 Tax=Priestia megaterium TaxID=1404 RepID=UPI002E1B4A37|nr:hypothetical protein [Priestia megaterium]